MKVIWPFFLFAVLLSCKKEKEYTVKDLQAINGYWQISDVIFPDGTKKKYGQGLSVEYIEVDGLKGFRKKVYPKLDGSFETNNDAISFHIVKKASRGYFISYTEGQEAWQEAVNFLSKDFFSLADAKGIIYCYNRFEPIDIFKNAEATE